MSTFVERLEARTAELGRICIGIDPHGATLQAWGLDDTPKSLEKFSRGMVEKLAEVTAVFKPQSAFFEAYGPAGLVVLEKVLADIRESGAISILDVKRGDIGSTMQAYAKAYLSEDSPLRADAITLSPYLGLGALEPAIELAAQTHRGVFVLARTSNPEGTMVQQAITGTESVAQKITDEAEVSNRRLGSPLIGLVIGATREDIGVNLNDFSGWVLAPGIGAQGGKISDIPRLFGSAASRVLPSVSREIANIGSDEARLRAKLATLLS